MTDAKIIIDGYAVDPMDLSKNPNIAAHAMIETGFACVVYGYATSGKMKLYSSKDHLVPVYEAYDDGIACALGVYTIDFKHGSTCKRYICNCKVH